MKKKKLEIISNNTCFSLHEKYNICCERKTCSNWIAHKDTNNCAILASKVGPHTLQEIGKIYGLTRMRICQIEKTIYEKVKILIQD